MNIQEYINLNYHFRPFRKFSYLTSFDIYAVSVCMFHRVHTYPVTATSTISGCKLNTASKLAGAICNRSYAICKNTRATHKLYKHKL